MISDFCVESLEKLQDKFELILKKFCKICKETVEKYRRNLMKLWKKLGKFWNC